MRVLVIETALSACTVGVFADEGPLSIRSEIMARGHSERLGGFARDVMTAAGGGFGTLDRIGVTVGPGSFTGLRVGLAFALGLGAALDIPVVGLSTLQALAWSAPSGRHGKVAAVIDARRGEVYLDRFLDGRSQIPPQAMTVEAAQALLAEDADAQWVGSGVALVRPERGAAFVTEPDPAALALLTLSLDPSEHPARPLYLRAPDATPPTRLPGQARAMAAVTP